MSTIPSRGHFTVLAKNSKGEPIEQSLCQEDNKITFGEKQALLQRESQINIFRKTFSLISVINLVKSA